VCPRDKFEDERYPFAPALRPVRDARPTDAKEAPRAGLAHEAEAAVALLGLRLCIPIKGGRLSKPQKQARAATWICPTDRRISTLRPPIRSVQRTLNDCCPSGEAKRPATHVYELIGCRGEPLVRPLLYLIGQSLEAAASNNSRVRTSGNASRSRVAVLSRPASGSPPPFVWTNQHVSKEHG
jgi:hypothetical protein